MEVCETSLYRVTYCNHGTLDAENVILSLILDDDLTFIDSEPSFTTSIDSLYTFDVGNLAIGECQTAWVRVEVDCNAKLSQAHCLNVSISPDEMQHL